MSRTELVQAANAYTASETHRESLLSTQKEIEATRQLNKILKSRSWQLTKPYRAAGKLLSKLLVIISRKKKPLSSNFIT
jgi:hypothetical protein